ncbi:transglutaminase-like domain-containing protein [Inquilinus sp. Marseille-Q2685]|uniref:transglutaminase-like domain-containing protein n=1 Tax=Inquilinus sp. Marseille-Q2685 TaxID=2866581 RepID=UPI001CE493E3|nr:transglutaminase-like domain-containing protein [Inquilinus sp. Marseille-Q2685]
MSSRRDLLRAGAALSAVWAIPAWAGRAAAGDAVFAPSPGDWRSFALTTRIALDRAKVGPGRVEAWVPLPGLEAAGWSRPGDTRWTTNAASAAIEHDPASGAALLHLAWAADDAAPRAEVTSLAALRDRAADLAAPGPAPALAEAERRRYLQPSALIPTDGIVRETADRITAGADGDLAKARALYEWVVANTYRDAALRGCGSGDVAAMLRAGAPFGGKCADINALFVGLARASGIPARDVYGIRVAPSRFGYRSLGANSTTVTKAQHCRAEVHLAGFGGVAADPADVRKVVLEEPPGRLALDDPKVVAAHRALFGAWEGNWIAYNDAHDVALPGSAGPAVGFLMYPQAEVAGVRLDCLDADTFAYSLESAEISA